MDRMFVKFPGGFVAALPADAVLKQGEKEVPHDPCDRCTEETCFDRYMQCINVPEWKLGGPGSNFAFA